MDINKGVTEFTIAMVTPTTLPPIIIASAKTITSIPNVNHYNSKLTKHTDQTDKEHKGYNVINDTNKAHIGNTEIINATETEKLAIIFSRFGPVRLFTVKKDVNIESKNKDKLQNEIHNMTEVFKHRDYHGRRQTIIQTRNFARDIGYFVKGKVMLQFQMKTYFILMFLNSVYIL